MRIKERLKTSNLNLANGSLNKMREVIASIMILFPK